MNDSQLKAFITAYEAGSFRKAAKEHFLTLPSFVRKITTLEAELGHDLFLRTSHGIKPTNEGEYFYPQAAQILDLMNRAKFGIGAKPESQTIRVGIWWRTPAHVVNAAQRFSELHPGVSIDFIETNWNSFAADLVSEKIDVYFGPESSQVKEHDLMFLESCRKPFYCAFSPQSKLAEFDVIDSSLLEDYIVYAGGDWRTIPSLTPDAISFFSRDNVVKESIFADKLMVDCIQDRAVSTFIGSARKLMPALESRIMNWPEIPNGASYRKDPSAALWEFIELVCKNMKNELMSESYSEEQSLA